MPFACCFMSSPPRLSSASVVFDFNASLIDVAPVSPRVLSVDFVVYKIMSFAGVHFVC